MNRSQRNREALGELMRIAVVRPDIGDAILQHEPRRKGRGRPRRMKVGESALTISTTEYARSNHPRRFFYFNGRAVPFTHLMILFARGEEVPEGCQVDHIDGDTLNDRPENLQVLTAEEHGAKSAGERWTE